MKRKGGKRSRVAIDVTKQSKSSVSLYVSSGKQHRRSMEIEDIPGELLEEILCRLPGHSVAKNRCVSWKWNSILNNSRFLKKHHTHLSKTPNSSSNDLILVKPSSGKMYYIADIETCEKPLKLDYRCSIQDACPIVGSINGLICLKQSVCNPLSSNLGDFEIPDVPSVSTHCPTCRVYGFGWNRRNDEYKVIKMCNCNKPNKKNDHVEVQRLTLGSNTWEGIGSIPNNISEWGSRPGVFLNGNLHWFVICRDSRPFGNKLVAGIRSLNVDDETFGVLSVPHNMEGKTIVRYLHLGVFRGCLMITDISHKDSVHIWVMKEYGVNSSWVLEFIIPKHPHYRWLNPVGVLKNGNLLLECNSDWDTEDLCSYDPGTRKHQPILTGLPDRFWAYPHVGTLVTVNDVIATEGQ